MDRNPIWPHLTFQIRYVKRQNAERGEMNPEDRLPLLVIGTFLLPMAYFGEAGLPHTLDCSCRTGGSNWNMHLLRLPPHAHVPHRRLLALCRERHWSEYRSKVDVRHKQFPGRYPAGIGQQVVRCSGLTQRLSYGMDLGYSSRHSELLHSIQSGIGQHLKHCRLDMMPRLWAQRINTIELAHR